MNIKYLIALVIGFFVVSISFLLNILFSLNLRFGVVYSGRVGHLCVNVDSYLSLRKENEIAIFGFEKNIANKEIFNLWLSQKNIYFSKFGTYGYLFLKKFANKSKMYISWDEYNPKNVNPFISKKNIVLTKNFLKKGKKILLKYRINKPYICLHNRDEKYLNLRGGDGNDHLYRNHDFEKYNSSINFLLKKNYCVVRVGRNVEKNFIKKNKNFISMIDDRSNDFNDLFLISQSKFLVSQTSGVANISALFRKKQLLINVMPFNLREFVEFPAGSLFIPKKLYNLKKKRLLKLHEICSLKYSLHKKNFFKKRGLKVIQNTEKEIKHAIEEMLKLSNNKKINYNNKLQEKFWNSMTDKHGVKIIRQDSKINICNSFLKLNKKLI